MTSQLAVRQGSRAPRVSKYPVGVSSSGREAIELAASAGLVLDPWQQDVLEASLRERPDGKWAAFEVGVIVPRQNGKGSILEARELAGLFLFGERMIVHTSHEFKTSLEAFRRIRYLIESTPDLDRKVNNYWQTTGREGIELIGGAQLRFVARSKGSGRGFSGDLVILDEAFALDDQQIEALLPTLSARPNPQLWYTSSPPLDSTSGLPLFSLKERGESPKPSDGLCWMDWGCAPGVDVDDRQAWASANPALGIRISEEFIARERAAMTPEGFARERLGVWPPRASGAGVIPPETWAAQADKVSDRPAEIALAVQVNYKRTYTAIAAVGRRADGSLLASIVDYRPGTHWVVKRTADLVKRWDPITVAVQDKGPTGSLLEDFAKAGLKPSEDRDDPRRGEIAVPWADDVADAYGMFVDAVLQGRLWHLDEAPLNVAVASAETRPLSGATAWEYKGDVDSSPLQAATLALWAYETRAHLVRGAYDPLVNIF